MRTGLFHPGKQHSWQVAAALQEAEALAWYATAIYSDDSRFPYRAARHLPRPLRDKAEALFRRRSMPGLDATRVRHLPAAEWTELALARFGFARAAGAANRFGNDWFQRAVLGLLRREPVARLWGFDTSSRRTFAAARREGVVCVLDQSIAHPGALRERMLADRARYPDLIADADIPSSHQVAVTNEEISLANHVLVGSSYAKAAAVRFGADPAAVHVCPYGYDERHFPQHYVAAPGLGSLPVKFVFVGTVSARKGFHLLLETFRRIPRNRATLTMVGPATVSAQALRQAQGVIDYRGPLANDALAAVLGGAHCFVFPSLHEGGGIVLYEAAACGLGIIQSPFCGDGVRDGACGPNGVVLGEASAEALQAAVESVLSRPAVLRDWAAASWHMREERSWAAYRRRIAGLLPVLT